MNFFKLSLMRCYKLKLLIDQYKQTEKYFDKKYLLMRIYISFVDRLIFSKFNFILILSSKCCLLLASDRFCILTNSKNNQTTKKF